MKQLGVAAAWIGTAAAVIVGMYITKSIDCLWFLLIPFLTTVM